MLVSAGLHQEQARYLRYDAALAPPAEWTGPAMVGLTERNGIIAGVDSQHAMWAAPPGERRFLPLADGLDLPLRAVRALPDGLGAMTPQLATPGAAVFHPDPDAADDAPGKGQAGRRGRRLS